MKNFQEINDLPILDLLSEYKKLLEEKKIYFSNRNKFQLCLNSTVDQIDNIHHGIGSLDFDWDDVGTVGEDGNIITKPKLRKIQLKESDFKILCSQFKGTMFEEVYTALEKKYILGRVRIMKSTPKTCLSWHYDYDIRVHYPIETHEGCLMIIEDEVMHLSKNKWWYTNTQKMHTALNASTEERIHLVVNVISSK
jgi:hypothetical protein